MRKRCGYGSSRLRNNVVIARHEAIFYCGCELNKIASYLAMNCALSSWFLVPGSWFPRSAWESIQRLVRGSTHSHAERGNEGINKLMLTAIILFLLLGLIAGFLAGLLGVGGGLIIVPVLAVLLPDTGVHASLVMHVALGTSLATIVATSMASAWEHHKHQAVLWSVFWRLTPGIIIGAWLGAVIADQLTSRVLQWLFGVFELLVAVQMFFGFGASAHRQLPGTAQTGIAGTVIGSVSAIVGIGGGTMTVPFLVWCNVTIRKAVATSAAVGLPIALAGSSGYIIAGMGDARLPEWSTGYVYWPAFAAIISTSLLFAPVGARLAHRVSMLALKKGFALLLVVLGVRMLVSAGW